MNLIYEDNPVLATWFKLIIYLAIALTLVLGIVFIFVDIFGAAVMFAVTVFDGILFYCVIPRNYQIYTDHIRITLGGPLGYKIPFGNIKTITKVDSLNAMASAGMRFTTSTKYVVEIRRKKGMSVIISPSRGDYFIEQFNQARRTYGQMA